MQGRVVNTGRLTSVQSGCAPCCANSVSDWLSIKETAAVQCVVALISALGRRMNEVIVEGCRVPVAGISKLKWLRTSRLHSWRLPCRRSPCSVLAQPISTDRPAGDHYELHDLSQLKAWGQLSAHGM